MYHTDRQLSFLEVFGLIFSLSHVLQTAVEKQCQFCITISLNRGTKTLPIHVLGAAPFCTASSTKLQFVVLFKGKFINDTNLPHSNNFKAGRKKRTVPLSSYCSV